MKLIEQNPKVKLTGFGIRVDEYLGSKMQGSLEVHDYQCTKIDRADGTEISSHKLASTIPPTELEVDEDGVLVEAVNRLSRPTDKSGGKSQWIVQPGKGFTLGEDYGF